ncbi:MAG: hypothetical protein OEV17_06810 [Nitrospira sp.]|nr:hypothetical protein [Nitrospira sp.]
MLHRMALRVLPSLSLVVTEDSVRKQKRIVMFVPGFVAFGVYRLAKHLVPLDDALVLLSVSSLVAVVTALVAYRVGRAASWSAMIREDGSRLLGWVAGWIGAVYGVQLSLLVLAILWMAGYSYLQHPDGPAMMAIIISCTSVARDAFEIGHVRKVALMGKPMPTFPDGTALRRMLGSHAAQVGPWVAAGLAIGAAAASFGQVVGGQQAALVQLAAVTILGGAIALCAYFGGLKPQASWMAGLAETKTTELLKYWWWPGLAFAATYYLVAIGLAVFVLKQPELSMTFAVTGGALVTGLIALYGYYLGYRRNVEEQQGRSLSPALLRCPFVMGILGKSANMSASIATAPGSKG